MKDYLQMKKIRKWTGKNKIKIFYFLILIVIFIIFIVLASINYQIRKQLPLFNIYLNPISFTPEDYPKLENTFGPYISAQGAVVLDKDSQVPLFEKNSSLRFSPASTTKIMTALVALEHFKPDDILTVESSNIEGSVLGLEKGEKLSFDSLLYAMMLPSANDATKAIADNYPGGEDAFIARMNEKAKELGLLNTYFADPIGLMDENDYTTPVDLARLTSVALDNPEIAKVVSTKKRTIKNTRKKIYDLENLNILLDLPGVNGVKTGFTQEAGQVLVTSRKNPMNKKDLIIVVMQSEDRFGDTESLLNFLENNVSYQSSRR